MGGKHLLHRTLYRAFVPELFQSVGRDVFLRVAAAEHAFQRLYTRSTVDASLFHHGDDPGKPVRCQLKVRRLHAVLRHTAQKRTADPLGGTAGRRPLCHRGLKILRQLPPGGQRAALLFVEFPL